MTKIEQFVAQMEEKYNHPITINGDKLNVFEIARDEIPLDPEKYSPKDRIRYVMEQVEKL